MKLMCTVAEIFQGSVERIKKLRFEKFAEFSEEINTEQKGHFVYFNNQHISRKQNIIHYRSSIMHK